MFRCSVCGVSATSGECDPPLALCKPVTTPFWPDPGPGMFPSFSVVASVLSRVRCNSAIAATNILPLPPPHSPAETNLQEHLRGRGHQRALDRLRLVERSVYVRGFASETNSSALQALLEDRVGSVDKVWVSDNVSRTRDKLL